MEGWRVEDLMHRKFDSFAAVQTFMQEWQEKFSMIFTICRSSTLEWAQLTGEVNMELKYYSLTYGCKFSGSFKSKSAGERKTSTFKQNCPAAIKLRISKDRQSLQITSVNLYHNHDDIPEDLFNMIPERRKLPPVVREEVTKALKLQCNKKLLQVQLKQEHGIHVTTKDLWNLQGTFKDRDNEIMQCINILHEKGADVEVLIDRPTSTNHTVQGELKGLYFSTPDMRHSMTSWPHIVFIDGTYLLLMLGLTVMILMVEDSNGVSEIVGVGLLVKEDRATFEWFLETFKKLNASAVSNIKCFMGDKDLLERDILKELFPDIPIYICQFHVLRTFGREISTQKYGINNDEKKIILTLLEKLVKSSSEEDYERNYDDFCDAAPTALREYFDVNWHSIKGDWAQYCMVNGNLGNNTNNRLESVNSKLKQVIKRKSSLVQFVKDFFAYRESHNLQTSYKLLMNFHKKSTSFNEKDNCEQSYMDYLTAQGFSLVLSEIEKLKFVTFVEETATEQSFIFRWKNNSFTANVNTCECATFKSYMLPCRHIFASRRKLGLPLFQKDLCEERWTKDYYKLTQRVFNVTNLASGRTSTPGLAVKQVSPRTVSKKERLKALSLVTKSLQTIASLSTGGRFDCKVGALKELNVVWQNNLIIEVLTVNSEVLADTMNTEAKGARRKIVSVLQKRKILKPLIDDLMQTARESVGNNLEERTNVLQKIEEVWRSGSDVSIRVAVSRDEMHLLDDSSVSGPIDYINVTGMAALRISDDASGQGVCKPNSPLENVTERMKIDEKNLPSFPAPVKVLGRPSLSLTTTVSRRRKKPASKFFERSANMQIETMLSWILPQRVLKSVLDHEYRVQSTDIDLEAIKESFMCDSVKLDSIEQYFDHTAYVVLKNIIQSKIEKDVWTCDTCKKERNSKSVLCESCLLWFHFECVSLKRKPSIRATWFCPNCKH